MEELPLFLYHYLSSFLVSAILLSRLVFYCRGECSPFSCKGSGFVSFDYPFGGKNSGCGDPELQMECWGNVATLHIYGRRYMIVGVDNNRLLEQDRLLLIMSAEHLRNPCNISLGGYEHFLNGTQFHVANIYQRRTFGMGCSGTYTPHDIVLCGRYRYYDVTSRPDSICDTKIDVPVLNSTEPLKTFYQGIHITWNASKYCKQCPSSKCDFRNFSTSSFCFCDDFSYLDVCPTDHVRSTVIVLAAYVGWLAITPAVVIIFLTFCQKMRKRLSSGLLCQRHHPMINNLQIFSYEELEQATSLFDENKLLGDGGFGSVYLGKLRDGRSVAVKKLYQDKTRGVEQFMNEVHIVSSLNHPNLVRLYGNTCPESRELLLVYEYLPNGTLADHLHGSRKQPNGLAWGTRFSIAKETAQALAFLHSVDPPIFHRDVKSSNILLDENFRAKVADFGLSRLVPLNVSHVSTAPQGTPGYVDPEYHQCFQLTQKSDVYSFGVVLVEIISAKLAVDMTRSRKEISLANMAVEKIKNGTLYELIDPFLEIQTKREIKIMVCAVAELALACLSKEADNRPDMREVAACLEEIGQLQENSVREEREILSKESSELKSVMVPITATPVHERWPAMNSDLSTFFFLWAFPFGC